MTERKVSKLKIAQEYLEAAIEFFLARRNFFCAIHLAGAAEELFGAHLPKRQRISTLAVKAQKALLSEMSERPISDKEARRSVNKWRNEVKHMDDGTPRKLTIDAAFMAEHHIEQALINFSKLKTKKKIRRKSTAVWRFEDYQNRKVRNRVKTENRSKVRLRENRQSPYG